MNAVAGSTQRWGTLLRHLRRQRPLFFLVAPLLLVNSLLSIAGPFISGAVIDAIVQRNEHRVTFLAVAFLFAITMSAAFTYGIAYLTTTIARRVARDLGIEVFDKIQRLPIAYFRQKTAAETATVLRTDVEQVAGGIESTIIPSISTLALVIVTIASMCAANLELSLVSVAVLPVWLVLTRYGGQTMSGIRGVQRSLIDRYGIFLAERLGYEGALRTKTLGEHDRDRADFSGIVSESMRLTRKAALTVGIVNVATSFSTAAASAGLLVFGGWLVIRGQVSVGVVTAFLALQSRLYFPVQALAQANLTLASLRLSLDRVDAFLGLGEERTAGGSALPSAGELSLDDVTLSLGDRRILRNVSCSVAAGEHVALVGRSGSGKSSIALLLLGLMEIDSGRIQIDGLSVASYSPARIRDRATFVFQEPAMVSGSVRTNLTYGTPGVSDDQLLAALRAVMLDGRIDSLDADVGAGGLQLSGGERQRLVLARAVVRESALYIFDEATSALDLVVERHVIANVLARLAGRTVLFITHRLTSLAPFDRILVLDDGRIVESGSYDALVAAGGVFATMLKRRELTEPAPDELVGP